MMKRRPPADNYPDEFDTPAYVRYRPGMRPGLWHTLRQNARRGLVTVLVILLLALSFTASLFVLPAPSSQVVVILPTPTPVGDIAGDFPPAITQNSITLPARINNTLAPGTGRGYRFFAQPGVTWRVTITSSANFDPTLVLYNPDGTVQEISTDPANGILLEPNPGSAQYGVLVQADDNGGEYTLRIFPEN
ncbi:MAG: hypothetical protein ACLFTK_09425 [Anaerolineales bacterium]